MPRIYCLICLGFILLVLVSNLAVGVELTYDDQIIVFDGSGTMEEDIIISLPEDAKVSYFGFDLVGPVVQGANKDTPWNLTLDIGNDDFRDWHLSKEFGSLGYQQWFFDLQPDPELRYVLGSYNSSAGFYLPAFAEISNAELKLEYFQEHYISHLIHELNYPDSHRESPYDYDPNICEYHGRAYIAYRSYGWRDTNQSDADIALNSTHDGFNWQDKTIELSKAPDTEVPYQGGKRSGDFNPCMAVFKDKLYCAWESDSPQPVGSTHDTDRDIVWTRFDGQTWEPPHELTAPDTQASEDVYSENPGVKHDYRVQLCTFNNGSGEQLFAIWSANNTGDEKFFGDRIGDIMVSRTTDGEEWTVGVDLTADDRRYEADYLPQLIEFKTPSGNALFAFWVTNNEKISNGTDWDIAYRYTFDGITWSQPHNLIEACGVNESGDEPVDEDPMLVVFNGELYAIWRSSNPSITTGDDVDIVIAHTKNGLNWSKPVEVTPANDTLFNNVPRATVFNDKLVVFWRAIDQDDDGAIMFRVIGEDRDSWLEPVKFTPQGIGGNDYSPDVFTFQDKILVSWVTEDNTTAWGNDSDVMVRAMVPRTGVTEVGLDIGHTDNYNELWAMKKTKLTAGSEHAVNLTARLRELLANPDWVTNNSFKDWWGNLICYFPINLYFTSPGRVILRSIEIQYDYNFTLNQTDDLRAYLEKIEQNDNDKRSKLDIPIKFRADTEGKFKIQNLKLIYTRPTDSQQQYPELFCLITIVIILIVFSITYNYWRIKKRKNENAKAEAPKKTKKKGEEQKLDNDEDNDVIV